MQIFLSYAAEDRESAEAIQLALVGSGYSVFFDKESLPPGGDYFERIRQAASRSDLLVFLVSPHSVAQGSFALTELKHARAKWSHPKGRVLPVMLHATSWEQIPPYLKSVTVLEPEGNVAAEVLTAVNSLAEGLSTGETAIHPATASSGNHQGIVLSNTSQRTQILLGLIALLAVLGASLFANWDKVFKPMIPDPGPTDPVQVLKDTKELKDATSPAGHSASMKGADTGNTVSPSLNSDCPEITVYDYSKYPPDSKIERRCLP